MKKLIIVGNKNITGNEIINNMHINEFVDSFDLVFRVNKFDNYGKSGLRTDGAWLETNGHFVNNHKNSEQIQHLDYVFVPEGHRQRIDNVIFNEKTKNNVTLIGTKTIENFGCNDRCVSTIRLAYSIINDERFNDYEITIICFDSDRIHSGSQQYGGWHTADRDQMYVDELKSNYNVKFIDV